LAGEKEETDELGLSQAHAALSLQNAVRGLTSWVGKTASLQELNFMSRFRDWLDDHSSNVAGIEEAFERLTVSLEWSDCAQEHGKCRCPSGVVRYGFNAKWAYLNSSSPLTCSNEMFAKDPSPGSPKICQCHRSVEQQSWMPCAEEGRSCKCRAGIARFGADSGWAYKNISKPFLCDSSQFGKDPLPSRVKTCQCLGSNGTEWQKGARGAGATDGPLLWSCGTLLNGSTVPESPDARLAAAIKRLCKSRRLAGTLDVYQDLRFVESQSRWADDSGWLKEAYVTYMAGKPNSNFEWMATNLIRSVHLFSNRPIVVVNFDQEFEPPASWRDFPNLIVYRMRPKDDLGRTMSDVSFNFNKIRAMIGARVLTGIQVDLDQVIFAGMDSFFQATRRECNEEYPYPIMPVHWMSRDGRPGDPYYVYRFTAYTGKPSMRWNHAHPTWSFWALPFITDLLHERLASHPRQTWMAEDEDMLNVELWKQNLSKAWCKWDLEPGLYTDDSLSPNLYYDPHWYPTGLPLLFFSAHNTKHVEETDWLMTLMARCGEPSFRKRTHCPAGVKDCKRRLMRPSLLDQVLNSSSSEDAVAEVCCCMQTRENTPIFWQGQWYKEPSQVPVVDSTGAQRRCIMP